MSVSRFLAPIAVSATAESLLDSRGGNLGAGANDGEAAVPVPSPVLSGAATTAMGNDFASLVANSNFLAGGSNSPSVTQSTTAATNPAGLHPWLSRLLARFLVLP